LHLESDVIPPPDVIENLLFHKKEVISALYYSDEGIYRRPMIQMKLKVTENYCSSYWDLLSVFVEIETVPVSLEPSP
jgi:hypothetical protein